MIGKYFLNKTWYLTNEQPYDVTENIRCMAPLANVGLRDHWVKRKLKLRINIFILNIFIVPFTYDLNKFSK